MTSKYKQGVTDVLSSTLAASKRGRNKDGSKNVDYQNGMMHGLLHASVTTLLASHGIDHSFDEVEFVVQRLEGFILSKAEEFLTARN